MTLTPQEASDYLEIMTLLARIAQLADAGDIEDYLDCFSPDGSWTLHDSHGLNLEPQVRTGREELAEGVRERREIGLQGPGTATKHDVSSISIDVEGDTARASSYFRFYRSTNLVPELIAIGRYDDELVRTPGVWRLKNRSITRN